MFGKRLLLVMALLVVLPALPLGPWAAAGVVGAEPGLGGWSEPVNLSRSPQYDNAPAVAASADGAVAIGWERRVISDPTANQIIATGNAALGGGFREQQLSQTAPQKTSGGVRMGHDSL